MTEPVRLDKCVVELLRCSRADAQKLIQGGWVRVDGCVEESPQFKVGGQSVEVVEDARIETAEPATLLLHKPAGMRFLDCPAQARPETRWAHDDSGWRLLKAHFRHLLPRLPLDHEASGLVVLTQDARVQRRLSEDYASLEQEFVVEVQGAPAADALARLAYGLSYQGRKLPPCKVSWQNETRLRFAIKNVQPGQLRHMCDAVNLNVVTIRRLRVGCIPLRQMAAGEWRYLPTSERF